VQIAAELGATMRGGIIAPELGATMRKLLAVVARCAACCRLLHASCCCLLLLAAACSALHGPFPLAFRRIPAVSLAEHQAIPFACSLFLTSHIIFLTSRNSSFLVPFGTSFGSL